MSRLPAIVTFVLISAGAVYGQEWGGEIESVEIEIVKERQIALPRANRSFDKVPPRPVEPIEPRLTYDFQPVAFEGKSFSPVLRPLRLKAEELSRLYGRTVSAGLGNYGSPYLEAALSTKRDKQRFLATRFFHRSFATGPVDGRTSSSGQTELAAVAQGFGKNVSGGGEINYSYTALNFYGYPNLSTIDRLILPQNFNRVKLGGQVSNTRKGAFNYEAAGSFSYLVDNFKAAESEVLGQLNTDYKLNEKSAIQTVVDYFLIARRDENVDAKPRHLFRLRPVYQFMPIDKLTVQAGAQIAYENDTAGTGSNLHVYPHATARYALTKSVNAFARLTGNMERVSLHTLTLENPWLAANVPIQHTNKRIDVGGGLLGGSPKGVYWTVGFSASALDHQYFFVNDASGGKFDLLYFQNVVWRSNPYGEFGLTKDLRAQWKLRFDYFGYTSAARGFVPWHLPEYRGELLANIHLYKKLLLQTSSTLLGGIRGREPGTLRTVELPVVVDLNLKLDYLLSDRFALFVRGDNLLNTQYRLFLNYPVRGLQVLAGGTYNF
jgi:hypothetical protein